MEVTMKLSNAKTIERRKVVIGQREAQLKAGTKPNKHGTTKEKKDTPLIPLTEKDRTRIERELVVLKTRI